MIRNAFIRSTDLRCWDAVLRRCDVSRRDLYSGGDRCSHARRRSAIDWVARLAGEAWLSVEIQHAAYFLLGGYVELPCPSHDTRNMPTVKVVTVAHDQGEEHGNSV